ncbi:hypothetical protein [Sphingomonas sp. Leaf21]|uniref:hypothetical protein n=1 Tax=Sphingomonas sp. Leaf21 TaxID=2876550 RepID=UPI001E338E8B|nr:hypothetical protein [Sphingomonas sp. Leaf21]
MLMTLMIATTLATATSGREPVASPVPSPTAATIVAERSPSPMASSATRYCVVDTLTGSRIPTRVCRTADEWIAREGAVPTGRIARR